MKTFAVKTLGCKVNQYETQQIRELLQRLGMEPAQRGRTPDLVVVNTCCVTHIASAKSRQQVRKSRKNDANTTVVVTGCLPFAQHSEWKDLPGSLHIVTQKNDLPQFLASLVRANQGQNCYSHPQIPAATASNRPERRPKIKHKTSISTCQNDLVLQPIRHFSGQTRAFLKIQDGCDGLCSYCIIPRIRTNVCNKNVKIVLSEAQTLVQNGHKEIVLTGIFLGAYGRNTVRRKHWNIEQQHMFSDLVDSVARIPGLARLRLSSLEPGDVTDCLLDVFCAHDNIMPHLHLPLQSGSSNVLRRMCRQYKIKEFLETVNRIHSRLDRPAITTDIIVGFPGETDADFQQTCNLARQVGFSKIHVFAFSPRSGTPAERLKPRVPSAIIKERSQILRNLDADLQIRFRRQFFGQTVSSLIETRRPVAGRTKRYFMVSIDDLQEPEISSDGAFLTGILKQ
ncbi:MAG: tRNA (N(6)-L-threonylcarbamoyladenosine(37)-C(2))-methylthiotransferase MtaB [Sedimentisphaerales bacterium]|nr:tRNA (N(6)-L-threonylcarbamoyladenosine(37)-C(2))-methylthiotransferase MtaB [Sedimentisphaerales bacterium]